MCHAGHMTSAPGGREMYSSRLEQQRRRRAANPELLWQEAKAKRQRREAANPECPGEPYRNLFSDPCVDGYRCTLDNPEESFEIGGTGHCVPLNERATDHHHH
ncbi:hypothetical protein HPB52_002719 [Rhipicephalus sanguineus]|uniref:Uncharacterized protein n=1 Tax=Rhipicephalus sanguineus TaxID=34632 RepID=A0A9D4PHM8_RHISA|nr:hypothetical protein HPB52_002719 [Rhipicephalus sanguineus]